jgi:hypothetical protein
MQAQPFGNGRAKSSASAHRGPRLADCGERRKKNEARSIALAEFSCGAERLTLLRTPSFLGTRNRVTQTFTGAERGDFASRDRERGARLRIAPFAFLAFAHSEAAEGNELDAFPVRERVLNLVEDLIYEFADLTLRKLRFLGNGIDQLGFCQP